MPGFAARLLLSQARKVPNERTVPTKKSYVIKIALLKYTVMHSLN